MNNNALPKTCGLCYLVEMNNEWKGLEQASDVEFDRTVKYFSMFAAFFFFSTHLSRTSSEIKEQKTLRLHGFYKSIWNFCCFAVS